MKSSNSSQVLLEVRWNILLLTIKRLDCLNAVIPKINAQLAQIFRDFESIRDTHLSILTGPDSKALCAGNNLKFTTTAKAKERQQPIMGLPMAAFSRSLCRLILLIR